MRSIWKGSLSFGLVNVPIKLYSATEDHDVPLHQVHDKDGGRIRYKRVCEIDGETVDYEHIAKAYVYLPMGFSAAVECLNLWAKRRAELRSSPE